MERDIDHDYTDEIVCPYCGHTHSDSWELFLSGGDEQDTECHKCERAFVVTRSVDVSYSTDKKP